MFTRTWPRRLALATALFVVSITVGAATTEEAAFRLPDHYEFDATLHAAFQPDARGAFPIQLAFEYPGAGDATLATWQVDVQTPAGAPVQRWIGEAPLHAGRGQYRFVWNGKGAHGEPLPAGFYTVRLRAVPSVRLDAERTVSLAQRAVRSFALAKEEVVDQRYDVRIGSLVAPRMPTFIGLPHGLQAPGKNGHGSAQSIAASTLPYTIYYGNLHSQTNHSDGGTPVASCNSAETPQKGVYGPADAYAMMQNQAGGDFLLTSEHNHMYDGSASATPRASADPAVANALFNSGLTAAATYRSAHPDFLALYGNEWGVITDGGHLNIINPDGLASWEYNANNQLIGSVVTIKSDYANLYSVMKQRGWIGQFNHPANSGQFAIGSTSLAYNANGAEVMVLAEILNSSAFSTNTTQTETSRSTYTSAWNTLLERGYHVAPSSDQDNHCANWGLSFRNRTGVLLPNGAALDVANFVDALKARRAFATEDKTAQVVLTGNGLVMGQTISNSGALTLAANYASTGGGTAARVQFFEGVPGSNGTVTQLYEGSGETTITPAAGAHFYYVLVTEADGDRLWSAPIWVNQDASSDATPPTISAAESGTSGTITLSATATDNVGVTNVEFSIDGVLKGSDASSPYAMTLDSTTLSNAPHTLTAKAYDAAGNVATATGVSFTINNPTPDTTAPTVSAAESGTTGTLTLSATASDNVAITNVEFYVDGVLKGADASSPYALSLDSTTLANGSHTLTAKGYDAAGNVGTSSAVTFSVSTSGADTSPPSVTATESGITGTLTFSAAATDNVGVTKVEFYIDGVMKGFDAASPFVMTYSSALFSNGPHTLVAKAYDAMGNVGTSATVNFTINNTDLQFTETEPNGAVSVANTVTHAYKTISGTMGNTTDKDFFALSLAAGETVKLDLSGGPSTGNYDLYLVNASDVTLKSSATSSTNETLTYTNAGSATTVYAKVLSYSGASTTVPYALTQTYSTGSIGGELITNGGFESGNTVWTASTAVIDNTTTQAAHAGSWKAWLNDYGSAHTDTLLQTVTLPAAAPSATLTFWLKVVSSETSTTAANDTLKVQVRGTTGAVLATLKTYSNLDKGSSYVQRSFDLSPYKGQAVQIYFVGVENASLNTAFLVDDVSLK